MLDLKPLTTEQIPLLTDYLSRYPRPSCDYSVCNLIAWGLIYHTQYTIWREHFIVVNPKYAYVFYPIGSGLCASDVREFVDLYACIDKEVELILIPEDWQTTVPELNKYFAIREDRDWEDYVYSVDSMVQLSGKKLAKKKNLVSQFVRAYPDYKVLPITPDKHDVILRFTEKWRRDRNAEGIFLNTEFQAIKNILQLWDELPVDGILICNHDRIAAYSIFSKQTEEMVTIHFEKFDPDKKGSGQLINWETARYLQGKCKWLNREQDMGLEGLRQAKLSYMPDSMLKFILGTPLKNK